MSPSPTLPTLSIVTGPLPNGMLTFAYSQNIQASAGVAPIKWRISSGNLPPGLAPGAAPQVLSRFRDANAAQSSTFSVEVTDSKIQTASQSYTITISNYRQLGGSCESRCYGPNRQWLQAPASGTVTLTLLFTRRMVLRPWVRTR